MVADAPPPPTHPPLWAGGARTLLDFLILLKIDIDEFMNWFNGYDVGGEAADSRLNTSSGWQQEKGDRLYVKVRGSIEGGGHSGGVGEGGKERERNDRARQEEESEEESDDGDSDSSEGSGSGSTYTSSSPSPSGKATKGGGTAGKGGRGGGMFGWLRKTTAASSSSAAAPNKKEAKRKRWHNTEQEQEEEGQSTSMSTAATSGRGGGGGEGEGEGRKKKRRRRRVGANTAGDGPLASPSATTNNSLDESSRRGISSFLSPSRLLRGRGRSPAIDPWKRHGKTLRVVAEHQARTLLFRRARLRAQVGTRCRLFFFSVGVGAGSGVDGS